MIGTTLSHFRITAKLGEGGMGEVYLAEDTTLGRQVAIKVLPKSFTADSERLARFEILGIRDLFSTDLAQLEGDRVEIAPDGRILISVPLDLDIDHSITLETGWATQLGE